MKTTRYEDMFAAVREAKWTIEKLDEVMEYLRANPRSSVADIRKAVYKDSADYLKNSHASHLAAMLRTLRGYGVIAIEEKMGEPIQIEVEDWGPVGDNLPPYQIEVTDAEGNKYMMDNPYYKTHNCQYEYRKIKKWITPTIRVYSLR